MTLDLSWCTAWAFFLDNIAVFLLSLGHFAYFHFVLFFALLDSINHHACLVSSEMPLEVYTYFNIVFSNRDS